MPRFKVEVWCIGHGHYRGRALVETLTMGHMTDVLDYFEHFGHRVSSVCGLHGKSFLIPSLKGASR